MKERDLEGFRPVRIERAYHLTAPVAVVAFERTLEAFASSISPQWAANVDALLVDDRFRFAIRRWWEITNVDGKFACESLDQLRDHLGRRHVDRFSIKLDFRADKRVLIVRSDGKRVTVVSEGWARGTALRAFEPVVLALGLVSPGVATPRLGRTASSFRFDAFIVHASEDKATVARPMRDRLRAHGYATWLDRLTLKVGDSLREEIDKGLRNSRHGIVIFSPSFFRKSWPRKELDALFSLEAVVRKRMILPVLHRMTHADLSRKSPLLAARLAASMDDGMDVVLSELIASMGAPLKTRRKATDSRRAKRPA